MKSASPRLNGHRIQLGRHFIEQAEQKKIAFYKGLVSKTSNKS
jgi:hypothetical protein